MSEDYNQTISHKDYMAWHYACCRLIGNLWSSPKITKIIGDLNDDEIGGAGLVLPPEDREIRRSCLELGKLLNKI
jgi:hypothetical protein